MNGRLWLQISGGHLTRQCKICGGGLINTEPSQTLRSGIITFRNVAQYHKFLLLLEMTKWLLESA
jgi:hypothetical protein